jgi:hypothetical protein
MATESDARNMRLLAHCDLNGVGMGGEGLGLRAAGGRRTLFIAHENAPGNFCAVDVTDPERPEVVFQNELPHGKVRSNSLALMGDLLAVAYQTEEPGLTPAGVDLYDVSDPSEPRLLSFFDTSGPHSRGAHFVGLDVEGYAYVATGLDGWVPMRPKDHQFILILDVRDPANPVEAGRWWLPGTHRDDTERITYAADPRDDTSYKPHNVNVYPERPDRAYVGYLDGGVVILDIGDRSAPRMTGRFDYHPPMRSGFTHTVVPLFDRELLLVADEANRPGGGWDHPKPVWVMDGRCEDNLIPLSTLPMPPWSEYKDKGGRYGAHNIHENDPVPTAFRSDRLVFGAFFNAGIRVYDIGDPLRPEEVAHYEPAPPEGCPFPAAQMNDVYVDENRIVYGIERTTGGLYILEPTL